MKKLLLITFALSTVACAKKDTTPTDATPPDDAVAAEGDESMAEEADKTIVEVAVAAGSFNTLAAALEAADLVDTLQGPGPFTVFAPTDEAFAALPEGALDGLLADPEALKKVLLAHVVEGKVMAADVGGLSSATAVSGDVLPIDTSNGVMIGKATVTQADIAASNGVIHVIDTVILPGG